MFVFQLCFLAIYDEYDKYQRQKFNNNKILRVKKNISILVWGLWTLLCFGRLLVFRFCGWSFSRFKRNQAYPVPPLLPRPLPSQWGPIKWAGAPWSLHISMRPKVHLLVHHLVLSCCGFKFQVRGLKFLDYKIKEWDIKKCKQWRLLKLNKTVLKTNIYVYIYSNVLVPLIEHTNCKT